MKVQIKYVTEDRDRHGTVWIYFRKPGALKIRLPSPMGSPEFWDAYRRAANGDPTRTNGGVAAEWDGDPIRYVVEDKDRHGNVRIYYRKPGQGKIRLPGPIGSDDFWEVYYKAVSGELKPNLTKAQERSKRAGTFEWLCNEYYGSAAFKQLDERTQYVRRNILKKICEAGGALPTAELSARHIRQWRDARAETPESANSIIKALRQVFKYAVEYELTPSNPARKVDYLSSDSEGFHAWTIEEIRQYEAAHPVGTQARLALALLLYTGQRRSDIVRFGKQHVKDGWLVFTQKKNRKRKPVTVEIPVFAELQRIIDASPTGGLTFLTTAFDQPFTSNGFGNRFRKWCDEAKLPHCSAHGLRKAAASRLAELGCTEHEIMAVTSHKTSKEVERYTRAARRRVLAGRAMKKLANGED